MSHGPVRDSYDLRTPWGRRNLLRAIRPIIWKRRTEVYSRRHYAVKILSYVLLDTGA